MSDGSALQDVLGPRRRAPILAAAFLLAFQGPGPSVAGEAPESPQEALDKALKDLETPQKAPGGAPASPQAALDSAVAALETPVPPAAGPTPDIGSKQIGPANFRLIDISLDGLFAAGTSTEDDESLQSLQGGGHDPRKRGFTVQNVELSLQGAVDPYFMGEVHIVYFLDPLDGSSQFELEEAFLTTQQLPWGLQIKGGQMQTEFGRVNPQHPHQWDWLDQPVVCTRFFGPDGMRAPGARLGWLTPLPWYSVLLGGLQNANGESMSSFLSSEEFFEERPIGGRPFVERDVKTMKDLAYLLRWENGFDISDELSSKVGASLAYGPNATGSDGFTRIYGADVVFKWRPVTNERGWPFVIWQSEILKRDYFADDYFDPGADPADPGDDVALASEMLRDWGVYTQVLYGFKRNWASGLRYEYAGVEGSGDSAQRDDPFRDARHRISPLLAYQLTEFSRLRLQYNYDHAQHLESGGAHSVWLGAEIMFGAHAAHSY
jgi:hypothetical protein